MNTNDNNKLQASRTATERTGRERREERTDERRTRAVARKKYFTSAGSSQNINNNNNMLGDTAASGRFSGALAQTQPNTSTITASGSSSASTSSAAAATAAAAAAAAASSALAVVAAASTSSASAAAAAAAAASTSTAGADDELTDVPELPIRLRIVAGFQSRVNDVVYCPPLVRHDEEPTAVVYFGGDVQDFTENMETNRDSKSYIKYNLEATALLLRGDFPKSHIAVIRPARMEFKTFSCFDNFVRGNNAGVPDHTPMHHSLQHLEKLLHSVSQRLQSMQPASASQNHHSGCGSGSSSASTSSTASTSSGNNHNHQHQHHQHDPQDMDIDILQVQETVTMETNGTIVLTDVEHSSTTDAVLMVNSSGEVAHCSGVLAVAAAAAQAAAAEAKGDDTWWWRENLNLDKCKLILIGFSKGCVVLNQFIYEFHYLKTLTPDDLTMIRLLSRIKDMYWLDGGHGGAKNTWITSRSLLETLTRLAINIHVHVTPYQVQDERRPWIRREEKTFVELLRRLGAPLQRCLHFDSSSANLFTHFEVLQVFRQPCPPQPAAHISPTYDDDDDEK